MHFSLIDRVLSRDGPTLTALKHISSAEEYLQDHFPTYPVLPGVMMLEAMVQAARAFEPDAPPRVLGRVVALKYGSFVRPGDSILIHVTQTTTQPDGSTEFKGEVRLVPPGAPLDSPSLVKAAAGKFALRPLRSMSRDDDSAGMGTPTHPA